VATFLHKFQQTPRQWRRRACDKLTHRGNPNEIHDDQCNSEPARVAGGVIAAQGQTPATPAQLVSGRKSGIECGWLSGGNRPEPCGSVGFSNPARRGDIRPRQRQIDPVRCAGVGNALLSRSPPPAEQVTVKPTGQVQNSGGAAFTGLDRRQCEFIFATEDGL